MAQILLLPGMGADGRMYGPAFDGLNPVRCSWPCGHYPDLGSVAEEMIRRYAIQSGDWLIGSSMGGMVAQEIGQRLPDCPVVLLGSGVHARELRFYLRWMRPLARRPILWFFQRVMWPVGLFGKMLYIADTEFLTSMCRACLAWSGAHSAIALRLHGRFDILIQASSPHQKLWGGHLIALSRPKTCVGFIEHLLPGPIR